MAKPRNPFDDDKEKRDLATARAADVRSRTSKREGNAYTQSRGYPDLATMTEAENSSEKRATNQRLTENATTNSKIEALKALAIAGVTSPEHQQAALDELAKVAGVKVPKKAMDPKMAAMNKLRAAKGLPPLSGEEEPSQPEAQPQQQSQPQQNQSIFQPDQGGSVGQDLVAPQPPREASLGNPVTPHLGIGGAEITPENPTGNPANPWGAGGLFQNPTHAAAQAQQAQQAAMYPTGPVSMTRPTSYFPGEAMDRLAGGSIPRPPMQPPGVTVPPPPPLNFDVTKLVQPNVPPNENVMPGVVDNYQREPGNMLPSRMSGGVQVMGQLPPLGQVPSGIPLQNQLGLQAVQGQGWTPGLVAKPRKKDTDY